ncbi:MAG: N-acetylmuramoyl-L-alanine amidase [Ferruginibacter sp.]
MLKLKAIVLTKTLFLIGCLPAFSQQTQTPPVKKINTIIVDAGHGGKDGGAHGAYEGGLYSWEKNVTLAISLKVVDELKKQMPGVKVVPTRTSDIYQSPPEKADIANANGGDLFVCIHADATQLKTGSRITGYRTVTVYDNKVEWIKKGKKKVKKVTKIPREVEKPIIEYYKIGTSRSGTSVWIFAPHKTSDKLKAILKEETFEAQTSSDTTYENVDFNSTEKKMLANIKMTRYQQRSSRLANYINQEVDKTGREGLGVNQRQVGIWVLQATNMPAVLVETGFISNHDDERYLNSEAGQQELAESIVKAIKHYKEVIENPKQANAADSTATGAK